MNTNQLQHNFENDTTQNVELEANSQEFKGIRIIRIKRNFRRGSKVVKYKMKKNKLYELAIDKWGVQPQVDMCIEEMAELTQILLRTRRQNRKVTFSELAKEIADVEIMLEQMKMAFYCGDLVKKEKDKQLKKLREYIDE